MSTPAKKTKKKNPQTGKTSVYEDKMHKAKKPGKRVSASGNVYYERRANRSDVGKLLAPKKTNYTSKYSGKEELINGKWYPVTVEANSLKEAVNKLKVGQRKSYGTVTAIRGRFSKE